MIELNKKQRSSVNDFEAHTRLFSVLCFYAILQVVLSHTRIASDQIDR